jgi:hypothetical protein
MRKPVLSVLGLIVIAATTFAASGCVQKPPPVIPTDKPSAAPVFKTDAEALAAARETYAKYVATSSEIAHDGGRGLERLDGIATKRELMTDSKEFGEFVHSSKHTTGQISFRDFRLQSVTTSSTNGVRLVAYACTDVSKTRVLDKSNHDVTPDRPEVLPLLLTFVSASPASKSLLLDWSEVWDGTNFC